MNTSLIPSRVPPRPAPRPPPIVGPRPPRLPVILPPLALAALPSVLMGAEPPVVVRKTLLQELNLPAIWFLVACSLLVVWFVIDVLLRTRRGQVQPPAVHEGLRMRFARGEYQGAFDFCRGQASLLATVVAAGLRHAPEGRAAAEDAMATAIGGGGARFQNTIAYLSVIGVIAPMVGLTGTVLGMIDAFAVMGQAGAADPAKLSGAIGHVLHATAGGLIVAIPAFVSYYLLRNRVAHEVHAVSETVAELFRRFPFAALAGRDLRGAEACCAAPATTPETAVVEGMMARSG
jgi:biopolymer transport protein ExbB